MSEPVASPPVDSVLARERPRAIAICVNRRYGVDRPSCGGRGSLEIADAIEAGVRERRIDIAVERIVCFGRCSEGPNFRYLPGGAFTTGFSITEVAALLDRLASLCGIRADDGPPHLHLLGS